MKRIPIFILALCALLSVNAFAEDFSYTHYDSLLKHHVRAGVTIHGVTITAVDYSALHLESKLPDSNYSMLLKDLAEFDAALLKSREEKMAFWINVYNIGAIKTIIDHYPVDSIRSKTIDWLEQPWNRKVIVIGGKQYSLAEIENDILLDKFKDQRVHFGINCASVSCVDLLNQPYRASTLFSQLEEQGRIFLHDHKRGLKIDLVENSIFLSQIFKFDQKRFEALEGGTLAFITPYADQYDRAHIANSGLKIEYLEYDWGTNDLKNAR